MAHRSTCFFLAALVVLLAGCSLMSDWRNEGARHEISLTNRTDMDLFVTVLTEEALALSLLAAEVQRDQMERPPVAPDESVAIPVGDVMGDVGPGSTLVFVVYAAAPGENVFPMARMLRRTFVELDEDGFSMDVVPHDLSYPHLFGDQYWIMTEEDYVPDAFPPRLEDGELSLWVGFSGCDEGTFTLSYQLHDGTAELAIYHDYPDHDFDCERINFKDLSFMVADQALAADRVILLNPNRGDEPRRDAFVLKP